MLQLSEDIRFITTATIALKALKASFNVECRLLPVDELDDLREMMAAGRLRTEGFIERFLTGWPEGEVRGPDGEAVPFSAEAVERLLARPGAKVALVRAFYAGYDEATEGNFEPLPAT